MNILSRGHKRKNHSSKSASYRSGMLQLITDLDPRSTVSEAYRILTTNLNFKNIDNKYKYIAVTSSIPSEGKSTTAANLAVALAQTGKKVVLVDADLRRPSVHKIFGIKTFEGLTNSLVEGTDPLRLCHPFHELGLSILTAGAIPPNSSELLSSNRMKMVLEQLGTDSDFVILDCPPVLGLNDTLAIAPSIDGFLFVVGSAKAPRQVVLQAKEQLDKVGANLIGSVVNGISSLDSRQSYYYYTETK